MPAAKKSNTKKPNPKRVAAGKKGAIKRKRKETILEKACTVPTAKRLAQKKAAPKRKPAARKSSGGTRVVSKGMAKIAKAPCKKMLMSPKCVNAVSASAGSYFADVLSRMFHDIADRAGKIAKHDGRSVITAQDVALACLESPKIAIQKSTVVSIANSVSTKNLSGKESYLISNQSAAQKAAHHYGHRISKDGRAALLLALDAHAAIITQAVSRVVKSGRRVTVMDRDVSAVISMSPC